MIADFSALVLCFVGEPKEDDVVGSLIGEGVLEDGIFVWSSSADAVLLTSRELDEALATGEQLKSVGTDRGSVVDRDKVVSDCTSGVELLNNPVSSLTQFNSSPVGFQDSCMPPVNDFDFDVASSSVDGCLEGEFEAPWTKSSFVISVIGPLELDSCNLSPVFRT